MCSETFPSKRSCSCHFIKRHPQEGTKTAQRQGSHQCDFCDESFASKRSLAQHSRGAHAAEKSAALAAEIAERGTRYWTEEEHEQFLDALFQVGPSSNIEIANLLPSKTVAQVNSHKYKFLRRHPNWKEDFAAGRKAQGVDRTLGGDDESTRSDDESIRSDDESARGDDEQTQGANTSNVPLPAPSPPHVPPRSPTHSRCPDNSPASELHSGSPLASSPPSDLHSVSPPASSPPSELHSGSPPASSPPSELHSGSPPASSPPSELHSGSPPASSSSPILTSPSFLPPSPPTSPASPKPAQSSPINSSTRVGQSPPTNRPSVEQSPSPPTTPPLNTLTDPLVRQADDLLRSLRRPIPASQDHPALLQSSQAVYSPGDEELPLIHTSPVSPPIPVTASQISRVITEIRNNPTVSHPQSNSNPRPRDPHTTSSPPGNEHSASERAKNMRQGFMTDIAPLVGRSLSEPEWADFEAVVAQWTSKLAEDVKRPPRNATSWWKKRRNRRHRRVSDRSPQSQNQSRRSSNHLVSQNDDPTPPNPSHPNTPSHQPEDSQPNPTSSQSQRLGGHHRRIEKAKRLQRFYRANPRKCIRSILAKAKPKQCPIPMEQLEQHFTSTYQPPDVTVDSPPSWLHQNNDKTDLMEDPIVPDEVKRQLCRLPAKSAPGPDKISYAVWKWLDWEGKLLAQIFEICRKNKKIPSAWKSCSTILIHKKGEENVTTNWRPISLQNTLYKVYAALIARRLASWALDVEALSPSQKGFLPFEGCFEHNFLLQSAMTDARRSNRNLSIVWLDLKDAFGSVPHPILLNLLERAGLTGSTINIIDDIYTASSCCLHVGNTTSNPITLGKGVKQGCPLSPILFNFVIEGILRGVESLNYGYTMGETSLNALAYADDLCLLCEDMDKLTPVLERVHAFAQWAKMTFNTAKCGSLTMVNHNPKKYVDPFEPILGSSPIPALKWEDRYRYLGCKLGANPKAALDESKRLFLEESTAICQSLLTDWQKIDAIKRFTKPQLDYKLRTLLPSRSWAKDVDRSLRSALKKGLRLPGRTISDFLYCHQDDGGLGVPSIEDEMDIALVSQAFKFLANEKDPRVSTVARHQLTEVMCKRSPTTDCSADSLSTFLNTPAPNGEGSRGDVRSLWSLVRKSLHNTRSNILLGENGTGTKISINECNGGWNQRRAITKALREECQQNHLSKLLEAKDQGRSFSSVSRHSASNYWVKSGHYVTFSQYRFAHKARLNLLPVRTVQKRINPACTTTTCRTCHRMPETLGHVLNHCLPSMGLIHQRHNDILQRLVKAVPDTLGNKFVEQEIPGDPERNKPDLVIVSPDNQTATIVDVTVPFEGEEDSLTKARELKEDKYSSLRSWLLTEKGYQEVTVDAFVVGSLGSWDPANEAVLKRLQIHPIYAKLFRKLCCISAIQGSFNIWRSTHTRQRNQPT